MLHKEVPILLSRDETIIAQSGGSGVWSCGETLAFFGRDLGNQGMSYQLYPNYYFASGLDFSPSSYNRCSKISGASAEAKI